jgi:hypothetical protein
VTHLGSRLAHQLVLVFLGVLCRSLAKRMFRAGSKNRVALAARRCGVSCIALESANNYRRGYRYRRA